MPIGLVAAGVGAAGAIGGAIISSNASKDAAKTQANAANKATQAQMDMFNKVQSNLQPYMSLGTDVLPSIKSLLGLGPDGAAGMQSTLEQYPGYQFALKQGLRGVTGNLASKGLALSGNQVRGAEEYGQGLASNLLNQYFQQLSSVAGMGGNAAAGVGNAATQTGRGVADTLLAGGQATASGIVGSANSVNSGIDSALNNALTGYKLYSQQPSNNWGTQYALNQQGAQLTSDIFSDPAVKTDIRPADDDNMLRAIKRMPTYHYRYKPGAGDGGAEPRVGPMADDFTRARGYGDGKTIPMPQHLGMMHGAIRALAGQIDSLKRAA